MKLEKDNRQQIEGSLALRLSGMNWKKEIKLHLLSIESTANIKQLKQGLP